MKAFQLGHNGLLESEPRLPPGGQPWCAEQNRDCLPEESVGASFPCPRDQASSFLNHVKTFFLLSLYSRTVPPHLANCSSSFRIRFKCPLPLLGFLMPDKAFFCSVHASIHPPTHLSIHPPLIHPAIQQTFTEHLPGANLCSSHLAVHSGGTVVTR